MQRLIFLFSVAFCLSSGYVLGQQDPQISQFMYTRLLHNSGVAGSENAICANLIGRQQWVSFPGQPKTYALTVHAPVPMLHGGAGLTVISDQLGQVSSMFIKASYAYRMTIGVGELGAGLGIGYANKVLSSNWVSIDPFTDDPSIPDGTAKGGSIDFDLGLYYKTNELYVGLSTTHIPQSEVAKLTSGQDQFSYKMARHYYVMAGYTYSLSSIPIAIEPAILAKSDGSTTQMDLNATAIYNNQFWAGVSYRLGDALVPMLGVKYDIGPGSARLGYAYDLTTSQIRNYSSGSHEILLGYCFNLLEEKNASKHKSVRFL